MIVRFLKCPPAAQADQLTCVRDDGSVRVFPLPRAGVLPLCAVRCVVEATLLMGGGWFGTVAQVGEADETTDQARLSLILANLIQAEQWGGATSAEDFRQKLGAACVDAALTAPALTDVQLAQLRASLRTFGAAWRPLSVGQSYEIIW